MFYQGEYVSTGWTDPTKKVQHLGILKNATTYVTSFVKNWNWSVESITLKNKRVKRFTILRDPYSRWLSGFTEDLERYITLETEDSDKTYIQNLFFKTDVYWFLDFLIDKDIMQFDTHANLQVNQIKLYIEHLGIENIAFIKMSDSLGNVLNHWLGVNNIKSHFTNVKVHQKLVNNSIPYKRITDYFLDPRNINRKNRVLDYLQPDYELYNSVNFINPN